MGITLAMDLARLGVPSVVVDRRRSVPPNPRCTTTNARSMELLRRLGGADAVRAAGLPADFSTDVVYMTRPNGVEITRDERSTPAEARAGAQHGVAAGCTRWIAGGSTRAPGGSSWPSTRTAPATASASA